MIYKMRMNKMTSNNPFEHFGIEHLSASSINLFIQNVPLFIVRYLHKYKSPTNAAMLRGTVIDHALGKGYSIKEAQGEFLVLMNKSKENGVVFDEEKSEKEFNDIEKYLEIGIPFYKQLPKPVSYQKRVELQFDDVPIPIIGFVDFEMEDCIRDIKTTARRPSTLLPPVQRQLAIYATALEKNRAYADYLYVAKTKSEVITLECDDIDARLNEVYRVSLTIMNLLQNNNIQDLVNIFYPDLEHWQWSEGDKKIAKELWRIK